MDIVKKAQNVIFIPRPMKFGRAYWRCLECLAVCPAPRPSVRISLLEQIFSGLGYFTHLNGRPSGIISNIMPTI